MQHVRKEACASQSPASVQRAGYTIEPTSGIAGTLEIPRSAPGPGKGGPTLTRVQSRLHGQGAAAGRVLLTVGGRRLQALHLDNTVLGDQLFVEWGSKVGASQWPDLLTVSAALDLQACKKLIFSPFGSSKVAVPGMSVPLLFYRLACTFTPSFIACRSDVRCFRTKLSCNRSLRIVKTPRRVPSYR